MSEKISLDSSALKNKYHGRLQQIGRKESDWRD